MSDWKTVRLGDVCETLQGDCSMKAAEFKKLGDYVKIKTGKLDANASSDDGEYPFFTCSIEPLKISSFSYDCECCLVAGNGDLNVKYYNGKFDAYQRTYIIESLDKEKLDVMYLYFFLCSYIEVLRKQSIGGVIKYIKLGNLTDALIPIPSLEKQKKICRNLIKAQKVLNENQALFSKYDILIKSRFIEMFEGNKYPRIAISEMVEGKVPSAKKLFNKSDEIKYIDISSVDNKINEIVAYTEYIFENAPSRAQQYIRKNDILISTVRPNLKNIAINKLEYKETVASSGFCVLRPKYVPEYLFIAVLQDKFTSDMVAVTTGANYPAIKDSDILNYEISNPPLELQQQFATFAQQIDKSKFAVQKSLEKAETLYKSLMQRYFA